MSISCRWRPNTLWPLKPCHCNRVKGMKISEYFSFGSSSTKNNDFWSCEDRRMRISRGWWGAWYFRFCEFVCINIKNVSIIEVCIPFSLTRKVVASENDDRCSWKCSRMSTPGTRTNTLNDGIRPLPSSYLQFPIGELTLWLLRRRALAFMPAFTTFRSAILPTKVWMSRLLHLLHVRPLLLLIILLPWPLPMIWPIFLRVAGLIIAFHDI